MGEGGSGKSAGLPSVRNVGIVDYVSLSFCIIYIHIFIYIYIYIYIYVYIYIYK